jgi:peroxiredoxin
MHSMKVFVLTFFLVILQPVFAWASQEGTVAPDFSLTDMNGKTVTLQQFKGKAVFLTFWAPWCEVCKEEMPALEILYKKYNRSGLEIVGIDMDPSEELVTEFLRKASLTYTILIDRNARVRRAYRIRTLPAAYLIGKDGVIRHVHMGFGNEFLQMYEKEVAELLNHP